MCWSENASYASFLVGSATNAAVCVYLHKHGHAVDIPPLLAWQFGLLMQIPEAMEWRDIRMGRRRTLPSNIAFWLNVTQPVVAYLGVSATVGSHDATSILGLAVYALTFANGPIGGIVRPREHCPHLVLDWWPWSRIAASHLSTLWVLRRLPSFLTHALIFESTFLFSVLATKPCEFASVWCWSTFVAATVVFLQHVHQEHTH